MRHSQFDDSSRERAAWNAGKTIGTKRPFIQKKIWAIRLLLNRERRIHDRPLFGRRQLVARSDIDGIISRRRDQLAVKGGCSILGTLGQIVWIRSKTTWAAMYPNAS